MTDDTVRHLTSDDKTAEEVASLIGDALTSLADAVEQNHLCPQCVLAEMLVQIVGAAAATGIPAADIVTAVGEGLASLDDEYTTGPHHLH